MGHHTSRTQIIVALIETAIQRIETLPAHPSFRDACRSLKEARDAIIEGKRDLLSKAERDLLSKLLSKLDVI